MSLSKPNRSAATISTTRVDPAPLSGICVTCLDGCEGPCEIGRSALKGREVAPRGQLLVRSRRPRKTFRLTSESGFEMRQRFLGPALAEIYPRQTIMRQAVGGV